MPRATDVDVRAVIETDANIGLAPFIAAANMLVDRACADVKDEDGNAYYSEEELTAIETWLAAHFYATRDNRRTMEKAGSVSESYSIKTGLMLANSMFGQTAMMLDTNGGLAALSKSMEKGSVMRAGIDWLGTEPCASTRDLNKGCPDV